MIKGIDVSSHNPTIDWKKVKDHGYEFVYIKHSQGVGFIDKMFPIHFNNAKAAGLKIGLYHFASLNNQDEVTDAKQEAEFFLENTKHIDADLLPVIDVETNEVTLDKDDVERWIQTYCDIVGKCVLYSSAGFLNSYLNPNHKLGTIPLWLSGYPLDRVNPKVDESLISGLKQPKPPVGWNEWLMWQWTGQGLTEGVSGIVDLNQAKNLPLK